MSGSEVYGDRGPARLAALFPIGTATASGRLPRAWCPWCGNEVPVRTNGAFRQHETWADLTTHERCPASGLTRQEAQAMEDEWKAKLAGEDAGDGR